MNFFFTKVPTAGAAGEAAGVTDGLSSGRSRGVGILAAAMADGVAGAGDRDIDGDAIGPTHMAHPPRGINTGLESAQGLTAH